MGINSRKRTGKRLRNIIRVDYPEKRTFGWLSQVERQGVKHKKFFSDSVYGGKRSSLNAAIQYRDHILHLTERQSSVWRRSIKRRNNTSGIVGVARYERSDSKNEAARPYWCAFWDDAAGKRRSRKFSVSRHGEAQARALAIRRSRRGFARQYQLKLFCPWECVC